MISLQVGPGGGALHAPETVRILSEAGHEVGVHLSGGSREYVGPAAFYGEDVSGVGVDLDESHGEPDALVFAPADAAVISRLAHGLSESPAERHYASGARPVVVVPDLDSATASHPAILENLSLLRQDGCLVLDVRWQLSAAEEIASAALHALGGEMDGLRVLVTTGGTREPVDSVRFVGNRSSGKMGAAVARQAHRRGADVTVVAANVERNVPGVEWVSVETAAELEEATLRHAGRADALVMAAAVSDFTPSEPLRDEKIRRGGCERLTLELTSTGDTLGKVRETCPGLLIAGFAATHGNPLQDAREKLQKKGADMIVGNDISAPGIGFGSEENEAYIVIKSGSEEGYEEYFVPRVQKNALASVILGHLMSAIKHREV